MNTAALIDSRNTKWLVSVLFVITILSRIPFASQYFYHTDSVNMAFGMIHFNPLDGAPQFPGYIVYVAIAQITNLLFQDHNRTMVIISILSSGLSVVVLYYFARAMFNPITGLLAALFLASSPLFWFYGEIALPHTLDFLVITLSAWMLYRIMMGQTRWLWWTTVLLALVGGFRQQDLLFLAPLALFAGYRIGIVKIVQVVVLGALISVAWFVPLMAYSGGLQAYMAGSNAFTESFWRTTSIFLGAGAFGLRRNIVEKLIPYTAYAWSLAALPVLYWLVKLPSQGRNWARNRKVWFLLIWVIPVLAFYMFIHMGQQGLVFVFMPAFFLVSAEGLYRLFAAQPTRLIASTAAIVVFGVAVFVFAPTNPFGLNGPKLLTNATLRQSDQMWSDKITLIRTNFKPEETLLVAANWRFLQYYLPEFSFARFNLGAKFEINEGEPAGADYVNQPMSPEQLGLTPGKDWEIVVVDDGLESFVQEPETMKNIVLPDGLKISYLTATSDEAYWTDGRTFGLKPNSSS